ncbi:MAG: L-cysteine:1D-myo-inositol 2-amino-2-deoxy-alpha-D-glucopyranoside ligase [Thermomicrobiales bacterium]|jgi:L-cysteine:1D-myo-inositol 2-amino-2-deoxy-alpha-D-glucopyranoside ligase|nr:L-cysteine:1D-myo-inositol 2-amino-2-deoxy-alpha-D-glucopyranoside ligase [Thermomicrobiales bacterium]
MYLFNTQTGQAEPFSAPSGTVGIYVCGVTPYDTTHVGHAFTFLTFDILVRYLRFLDYSVTYVQNVTDIDDDILRKAKEDGLPWNELGRRETEKYRQDMRDLNALEFDHFTKATEHVPEMVALIEELIKAELAYVANGNVYFSVDKDPEFGKLSHIPRDQMLPIANERGNTPDDPNKRDPLDFVLWQAAAPGEPTWDSPWGAGRPGWHIECSAMSTRYLGPTFDIHGGGADLVFPHHECEIAQSEGATGQKPFARYWMHVGMVRYLGEKMSKSLGNLVLVRDALNNYSSDALRLYLFSHHYRSAWEYHEHELDEWATLAADLREAIDIPSYGIDQEIDVSIFRERFLNALDDDLDTPTAIEALREIAQSILEAPEEDDARDAQATLQELAALLGLTLSD